MAYLSTLNINTTRQHPFPFDVPAIKFAKDIDLSSQITFLVGENGTGKSTLLEAIACRLQLPHMDGAGYGKASFDAAKTLMPFLDLTWNIERSLGFFFRAEDFGDYLNSVHRAGTNIEQQMGDMGDEIPKHIIEDMKDSANHQLRGMRFKYGQELNAFSHGEAYLHIMNQTITARGIYLLDEPEAALSPARQLTLIYFIQNHLKHFNSQFIIATHSPMLLAYPNATIYEITENAMQKTALEATEHYNVTKSFLNNPKAYLRHFE
ncbi:AAA family ATPase [Subsaximicrobium wynnwilliamsii]|uniref:AAA family ATPase n=1 Tax=Subsaximicrobium wynnwilliamsii TaxID=291179 RepID=A0A5C6ZJV6_9FLAO|nr:AAA family ATPase [Subsaximicrobium wynnwilliamsii]TXD83767.1 AAA family ATPase [Subsaximicrobium wynnwilliamsii]TXD89350.1 AAA family ATPase [Subsaximicrobium wynnwilliamsii]TXE03603.1 AAA family ATPase [Subsaximicrobium wynnwilliamsii]